MKYAFLVESYETERIKVLSVWSEFKDEGEVQGGAKARLPGAAGKVVTERPSHAP